MQSSTPKITGTTPARIERICSRCHQSLPETAFKLRRVTPHQLSSWCKTCHAADQRIRNARHRSKAEARQLHYAWSQLAKGCQRQEVQKFIVILLHRFGGPRALADAWYRCFEDATQTRQLRCAEGMIFLLQKFQECPEALDIKRMDDLAAEQARLAKQIIREQLLENADSVAEIASELGYRLSPTRA